MSDNVPVRVISAHKVILSSYDFDFLMRKASREIERTYTEGVGHLIENIMNFVVTIDATFDYLWHSYLKDTGCVWDDEKDFKLTYCRKNISLAAIVDLSNTFKHSDRRRDNQFAKRLRLEIYPKEWLETADQHERHNSIAAIMKTDQKDDSSITIFSPVIHIIIEDKELRLPFRVAAEIAVQSLKDFHATLS